MKKERLVDNEELYKEIDLGDGNKIIFFRNINLWDKLLPTSFSETKYLDVVTYNFNFECKSEKSMYTRLLSIAEKGIIVRLFYSPKPSDDKYVDDFFLEEILNVKVPDNHSKIFLTDHIAFIGSANFSLSSNNNYECGFLSENPNVIERIRTEILNDHIWKNNIEKFTVTPMVNDPLSVLVRLMMSIERAKTIMQNATYKNEYVPFDCDDLKLLHTAIEKSSIVCDSDDLLSYHDDFQYFLRYCSVEQPQYCDEEVYELKGLMDKLQHYLDNLKQEIVLCYEKHGKFAIVNS